MLFVFALLVSATLLVALDLVLLAQREWHKARVRAAFQSRVRAELARDSRIHDRLYQMPLPEEADDYLTQLEAAQLRLYVSDHVHHVNPYSTRTGTASARPELARSL